MLCAGLDLLAGDGQQPSNQVGRGPGPLSAVEVGQSPRRRQRQQNGLHAGVFQFRRQLGEGLGHAHARVTDSSGSRLKAAAQVGPGGDDVLAAGQGAARVEVACAGFRGAVQQGARLVDAGVPLPEQPGCRLPRGGVQRRQLRLSHALGDLSERADKMVARAGVQALDVLQQGKRFGAAHGHEVVAAG